MKNETYDHENTNSEIDEKDLYEIDKLILGDNYNELRKRSF